MNKPGTVSDSSLVRRLLWPLRRTPLHPQWLVFSQQSRTRQTLVSGSTGWVLDIGCGDRWVSSALPLGCLYVGLDYPTTVDLGYPGHPEVFGNAASLPFRDSALDTVLMLDVLEHLASPQRAIAEAGRVLKPGGRLILHVPFLYPLHDEPHDYQRWTVHGLRRLCESHGLALEHTAAVGHPCETAAALFAIALAKSCLLVLSKKRISTLLVPLLATAIPLVNVVGWSLARLTPGSDIMPLGYRLVASKRS